MISISATSRLLSMKNKLTSPIMASANVSIIISVYFYEVALNQDNPIYISIMTWIRKQVLRTLHLLYEHWEKNVFNFLQVQLNQCSIIS